MPKRRQPHVNADPAARLERLDKAIGDTNSASFNREHHLRCILITLDDQAALELLRAQKQAA